MMRFVPEEVWYQRLRHKTDLMRLGCDGNVLFRCTARIGYLREASRDRHAFLTWASISEIRQESGRSSERGAGQGGGAPRM